FSSDGHLIVSGSRDGAIQVWRAASGTLQTQLNPRHSKILAVEFDRAGKLVLAAHSDGTVGVADAAQGLSIALLDGPRGVVRAAHFDPRASRVVGASWDGTTRIWDAGSPYRRWSSDPAGDNCGLGTTAGGRFIAISCVGGPVRIWDTAHDQLLAELPSVTRSA